MNFLTKPIIIYVKILEFIAEKKYYLICWDKLRIRILDIGCGNGMVSMEYGHSNYLTLC